MANYFSKFPLTVYNLSDTSASQVVTNILSRYVIEKNIRENMIFYDLYDIRDGDTAENLAHKIYGSAERHWLILAANDILDVETQWPLTEEQLNIFINEKYSIYGNGSEYGGLEYAKDNVHSYYKIEKIIAPNGTETITKNEVDSNTYSELSISSDSLTLTDGNIITIVSDKETKSYYLHEYEENEAKRKIKILRFQYVDTVEKELETVFSDLQLNNL